MLPCFCLTFSVWGAFGAPAPASVISGLPSEVAVRLEYRVALPTGGGIEKNARLWIPIPRDDAHQVLDRVSAPGKPVFTRDPRRGNRFLYYTFGPAGAMPAEVAVQFDVRRRAILHPQGEAVADAAIGPDIATDVGLGSGALAVEVSKQIVGETLEPEEKARRIYRFVFENMEYDKSVPGWGHADLERACRVGKGNCTDFHGMFLSFCRAQGIPGRFEMGLELAADGSTETPGAYHCWASFYLKGRGWMPVDISTAWKRSRSVADMAARSAREMAAGYGQLDAFRIAFSHGLDVHTAPAAAAPVRFIIDPVLEIDGKRIALGKSSRGRFQRSWSYQFLGASNETAQAGVSSDD